MIHINHCPFKLTKRAFTLAEFLVALALVGILAVLTLSQLHGPTVGSQQSNIAETYKTDIIKAFQLNASKDGLLQKSQKPTDVVSSALHFQEVNDTSTYKEFVTPTNWHVKVPKAWTPQTGSTDKADIMVLPDSGTSYTVTVYRDNSAASSTIVATTSTIDVGTSTGTGTVTTNNPTTPTPTPPTVNPVTPAVTWVATVNVSSSTGGAVSGASIMGSDTACGTGTTDSSGVATITNIPDGTSCSYTATKAGFTSASSATQVVSGNKSFNITMPPITWSATVTVKSTTNAIISGATVTGANTSCGSGTTNTSGVAVISNIPDGITCSYIASKPGYVTTSSISQVMTANRSFTINMAPTPTWSAQVNVVDTNGQPVTGATITTSIAACSGSSGIVQGNGVANITGIADGTTCGYSATAPGYSSGTSVSLLMNKNQMFTITLSSSPVSPWNSRVTVFNNQNSTSPVVVMTAPITGSCGTGNGSVGQTGRTDPSCNYSVTIPSGYTLATNNISPLSGTLTPTKWAAVIYVVPTWTVTVNVVDGNTNAPISGATVTGVLKCGSGVTNGSGKLTLLNIPGGQLCSYTGSASGYNSQSSESKVVSADSTFTITLSNCPSGTPVIFNGKCYATTIIHNIQGWGSTPANPAGGGNANLDYDYQKKLSWDYFFNNTVIYLNNNPNTPGTVSDMCAAFSAVPCDGVGFYKAVQNLYDWNTWMDSSAGHISAAVQQYLKDNTMILTFNGVEYNVTDMWISPIKVNLKGLKAELNSTNKFYFDADGFSKNDYPIIKTSGGLNADEAWLIMDSDHNGTLFDDKKSLVLDGDDLFGDHLGQYISGYENLEDRFKQQIEHNAMGERYITLHHVSWLESAWVNTLRILHIDNRVNPSIDLYLLDANNNVRPASDLLTRINVNYTKVKEMDAQRQNAIFQRAQVTYVDGNISESADQWFKPVLVLKPMKPGHKPLVLDIEALKRAHLK